VNDPKAMDRIASIAAANPVIADIKVTLEDKLGAFQSGGLPYEVALDAAQTGNTDPQQVLRQLLNFFLLGKRPAGAAPDPEVVPAVLHQYRDLARIRHDYPFGLSGSDPAQAVRTLSQIIDGLVAGITDASDSGERLKQHIYRMEPEIRTLVDQDRSAGLLGLWDLAAKQLLAQSQLAKAKKDQLRDNLARVRQNLSDQQMIACGADAPERLMTGLALLHWRQRCATWRVELDGLIGQVGDLLSINFNNSPESRNPEHLRETTATSEAIDFSKLSSILATSHLEHQLPEHRSQRIRTALDALLRARPLLIPDPAVPDRDTPAPFAITRLYETAQDAIAAYNERLRLITDFCKAIAIARLELANQYRDNVHDDYFQHYDSSYLSRDERALCPPVFVKIKGSEMAPTEMPILLNILLADSPIKILLQVDDLFLRNNPAQTVGVTGNWAARLAVQAMAMNRACVLQAPVSQLQELARGFLDGLDYTGPALFSVYVGNQANRGGLPRFFDAGTAKESRIFPVFTFNPGKGLTLLERLDISKNSQPDQDWPADVFRYRAADGTDQSLTLKFTPAGFLLNDRRYADQYWCLPPDCRHENLLPLPEFLARNSDAAGEKIPYIRCVDAEGCIHKVIMTRHVVTMVRECAASWRQLQELGGINNSYTLRQIAEAKSRLETDKQQEVAAIEEQYRVQMDQDIGRLTENIVGRIARQLLQLGDNAAATPMTEHMAPLLAQATPATTAAEAAPAPKPAAAEEDEEPAVSLDEPYIDTPLCTSCNDCMKTNAQIFGYDANKQAIIKDARGGPYKDLVRAAEICPVKIIHPGKPKDPNEPGLDDLLKRAAKFM